jgi:hypothetical protein
MLTKTFLLTLTTFWAIMICAQKKATICLTYDDGLPSHLQTVIPQLDSLGLKATFFLNSIPGASTKIGESSPALAGWKKASENGHELGNHTLFHPCPQQFGWAPNVSIDRYTFKQLLAEIRTQASLLTAIDNKTAKRSFAYPCNNTIVEGKDYSVLLKQSGVFTIARSGGDSTSVVSPKEKPDAMKIPSWLVEEGATLEQLIRFAEKARAVDGIAIYQFHGIGAEFFRVDASVHRAFLEYLVAHPEWYTVKTFSSAIRQRLKM